VLFSRAGRWVRQLNLFQTAASLNDARIRHDEIISTRIYIILTALCLWGVILFTSLSQQKTTVTIPIPSISSYDRLQAKQPFLFCSCSRISIPYSNLISLSQPTLHQVCSSPLIDQSWLSEVFGEATVNRSIARAVLSAHFRLLAAFCGFSQKTLHDAQTTFLSSSLLSITLLSRVQLDQQLNYTVLEFQRQVPNVFRRTLAFIVDTSLGNQVMSVYETNWHLVPVSDRYITMMPRYYGKFISYLVYNPFDGNNECDK
jgi:hypothetical protein